MTTDIASLLPEGISHAIDLSSLPLDERLAHHTKMIRTIGFHDGINGVQRYKKEHPEAAAILADVQARAYRAKPKGYAAYVVSMVETWLDTQTAVLETNRADVERLNTKFDTKRFNPDNHFSKVLPYRLREKLREAFSSRGIPFNIEEQDTLSKVRQAAKAAKSYQGAARNFSTVGVISGNTLSIGPRSFTIEAHNGHECLRLSIGGKRVRLRLDALEQVVGAIAQTGARVESTPTITIHSIGELAPDAEAADFMASGEANFGEVAPICLASPLAKRIAAIKGRLKPDTEPVPPDVDPLTL